MKKILGLNLATNSIGWALINEAEEKSSIIKLGVRVHLLTVSENCAMKPFLLSFYE